jgi:long-subunit acyl-CoA synthetase (AMP-forming)
MTTPIVDVVDAISRAARGDTEHHVRWLVDGQVHALSLDELTLRAERVAVHLHRLGIGRRDRVGVISANRIEWVLLDLAALRLGAVVAGIEPGRHNPSQIVREVGLTILFTEDGHAQDMIRDIDVIGTWALDGDVDPTELPNVAGYDPADIFAIKQTSGSTGVPKGIEATAASVNSSMTSVQEMFQHRHGDNLLVFLPVRYLQQRYWIYSALVYGHDITLADRIGVFDAARATSPTVIMGVPGFYEQLKRRLESSGVPADPTGRRAAIQAELGGRIRYLWTGSAPAGRAMLHFFNDAGVPLYEGYGLNETCIVAKNHPGAVRVGSVGKVLPHKRVRFDRDGILIVGADHPVNIRYAWSAPGASEKVYLPSGEVKTFDVGHLDEDGFLYIDGRVDEIVTLSGALNVLVPTVEERLRELPDVHDCAIFGDGRPFLTAIVSPAAQRIDHDALAAGVSKLNTELRYEQGVYAVIIADEQFSIENGLLNGQMKLKRNDICRRYAAELDQVYRQHDVYNDGTSISAAVLAIAAIPGPRTRLSGTT